MSLFDSMQQAVNQDVMKGIHGLKTSLNDIEAYQAHRLSAGIESFDSPTDKLVLCGLASMYPSHFEMGSGNEGLGALVDKIKKGLAGLKKSISEGKKDKLDMAPFKEAKQEVKNTIGKSGFFGGAKFFGGEKQVAVGLLQNYVGKGNKRQVIDAIAKVIPAAVDETQTYLEQTVVYWKQISAYVERLKKVPEGDVDAAKAILAEAEEKLPDPYDAVDVNIYRPWAKEDSFKAGDKLDALTEDEAEEVVKLIMQVIEKAEMCGFIGYQIVNTGQAFDIHKTLPWLFTSNVGHRETLNNMSWDEFTMPGNIGQSLQIENLLSMGRIMERWVNESAK